MRDIGKNIRDLREQAGLTQEAFAEKLFVTRQTVSNYENGKTRPDVDMVIRIAQILETDANHVLYGQPLPLRKKRTCKHLIVFAAAFAVLLVTLLILRPIAKEKAMEFRMALGFWLNFTVKPLMWTFFGLSLTTLVKLALDIRTKTVSWQKWPRIGLLVVWNFCILLMVPFGIFHTVADIYASHHDSVNMSFGMGKVLNHISNGIMYVTLRGPAVWALFGIFYELLRPEPKEPA